MFERDVDPFRFETRSAAPRGFNQAYVQEGMGGVPIVLLHGWPETKRIWWRNIAPLAAAGFEVIAPDLRGLGESALAADGFQDVPAHARDIYALVHDHLGHKRAVLVGGDLGGAVAADICLRFPDFARRLVLFNAPIPYDAAGMTGLNKRGFREAGDYAVRQGRDPDGLASELATPEQRRRYIATFYTSRFWGHPGSFDKAAVRFHAEPSRTRPSCGPASASTRASTRKRPAVSRRWWLGNAGSRLRR